MKTTKLHIITILIATILAMSTLPTLASGVPREAIPENTPQSAIDVAERYIGDTLSKVQNGMGYADAKAETNRILFNAFLNNQTGGYSYGLLTIITINTMKINWHEFGTKLAQFCR